MPDMDPMPPFTITPVLREAAELRIEELGRVKESFQQRYHLNTRHATNLSVIERVSDLLEDIRQFDPYLEHDDDLPIMSRYVEQAKNDKSVSVSKLLRFERQLRDKLNKHVNRMEVSSLHAELMREVMEASDSAKLNPVKLERTTSDDGFEIVEKGLDAAFDKFKQNICTAPTVDEQAIEAYLSSLFTSDRTLCDLEEFRKEMRLYSGRLIGGDMEVDEDVMMWIIMDLLKKELLAEETKRTLEQYLQSPIALRELTATMNMKSFRQWNYRNAHNGLPVIGRLASDGAYQIVIHEGIIDLLFLHCTAMGWASKLEECLKNFVRYSKPFQAKTLSDHELQKLQFYLVPSRNLFKKKPRPCSVCGPSFPPAFMPPQTESSCHIEPPALLHEVTRVHSRSISLPTVPRMSLPPPPPPYFGTLEDERCQTYIQDFFMAGLPSHEGCAPKLRRPEEIQAKLIKTLAAEVKIRTSLGDRVMGFSVVFDDLSHTMSHKAILTTLKFLGVTDAFLDFFRRFLEVNLKFGPNNVGGVASDLILPRSNGVSIGHGMGLFFIELLFFFLELDVHKSTGGFLYRIHDTCHFIGNKEQSHTAKQRINDFSAQMNLRIKSVCPEFEGLNIGFLSISTQSAACLKPAIINIRLTAVTTYAYQIKKRLEGCRSLLEWVHTWNITIGTYAKHLFGPLAEVFCKSHLDAVNEAYNKMVSIIFPNSDLTTFLKKKLEPHMRHLKQPSIALEAFIYLPQCYGGLGVKNPFITINLAHKLCILSDTEVWKYIKEEETYYACAAQRWRMLNAEQRQDKLHAIFESDQDRVSSILGEGRDLNVFMSFEDLTSHREYARYPLLSQPHLPSPPSPSLLELYQKLIEEPVDDIDFSWHVHEEISRISGMRDMKPWYKLSSEEKWVMEMYSKEAFELYGTLEIWWAEGVPREVYKAVRGHTWSDGSDDASSTTSMSQV